ncbi:hypothetical protein Aca07nite_49000 [Actinoplanes capillaceus]|uniref:DUF1508 domain-containing protein n=1 Tax=Actinoplanes campanulatus TaxID=113559 RepID=A0ABQ3WN57_9ACTN|nr:hypothetical protein [Actinoplanes capillaceus]GID47625.1 hypothetical protein Aca07nite_49000 [Actinoplanes capillaceus]
MIRYEVRKGSSPYQRYYCRAVSTGNNAVLMTSETYHAKADAIYVANLMKGGSAGATVVDLT